MHRPLPRRLDATEDDLTRASLAAQAIAAAALGRDPGPMATAASMSHYVFLGADIVVKLVDSGGHHRLDLEIALAPHLPPGLGSPLLGSGRFQHRNCDVRYGCFSRMPGTSPGVGLPDVDAATARRYAEQAVERLHALHTWTPTGRADQALKESPVHEGFTGRAALLAEIAALRDTAVPSHLVDGLAAIADAAPAYAADVPVHADCDWGNWLADGENVTALLDFERARYGSPADDWVLLAATSGPHLPVVLDVIEDRTGTSVRADCEVRDAAFLAEDLHEAVRLLEAPPWMEHRLADLEELVGKRRWAS